MVSFARQFVAETCHKSRAILNIFNTSLKAKILFGLWRYEFGLRLKHIMHSLKCTNRLWSTKYRIIWCILYRKICHKIAFLRVFMTIVVRQILPFVVRQKVFMVKSPEIYRMKNTTVFFINSNSFDVRQK